MEAAKVERKLQHDMSEVKQEEPGQTKGCEPDAEEAGDGDLPATIVLPPPTGA